MADTINVGLLGTGDIGRLHARAWTVQAGVNLVVTRGLRPEAAERLASELGADVAPSYRQLLDDDRIDAIDLCVPNHLHAEAAIAAAEAGKHILCEKPLAMSLEDAERINLAIERSRVHLMVGHLLRFWPAYRRARQAVLDGTIGEVNAASTRRMLSLNRATSGQEGWRRDTKRSGGAVIDLQIHDLDFLLWTFGMPQSVYSRGVGTTPGCYDHVQTVLDYGPRVTAALESSALLQGNPVNMGFLIVGEEGSLEFSYVDTEFEMHDLHAVDYDVAQSEGSALTLYRWEEPPETLVRDDADPVGAALAAELQTFARLLRNEEDDVPGLQEATAALQVALASRESCQVGRAVKP